jgi:hypothetical protein
MNGFVSHLMDNPDGLRGVGGQVFIIVNWGYECQCGLWHNYNWEMKKRKKSKKRTNK